MERTIFLKLVDLPHIDFNKSRSLLFKDSCLECERVNETDRRSFIS